jgi:hypothetical protein
MSGQSCLKSRSSRRRLVRKKVRFEGPTGAERFTAGGFNTLDRRLRDLAREELLVDEDILAYAG